jgi:8-oxo-dGTP diphosphatase
MISFAEQLAIPATWLGPTDNRLLLVIDVHIMLLREGTILLGRRQNTGYKDGHYHLPAGHLEGGESVVTALLREAWEELGILVDPDNAQLVHVMHQSNGGGRIGIFFRVEAWEGDVVNREPAKCSELRWFRVDSLPRRMVPYARKAILAVETGRGLSLHGWTGLDGQMSKTGTRYRAHRRPRGKLGTRQ